MFLGLRPSNGLGKYIAGFQDIYSQKNLFIHVGDKDTMDFTNASEDKQATVDDFMEHSNQNTSEDRFLQASWWDMKLLWSKGDINTAYHDILLDLFCEGCKFTTEIVQLLANFRSLNYLT